MSEIILRPFQASDIPFLTQIVCETWDYNKKCKEAHHALNGARQYLLECLCRHNYSCVALLGNRPVGLLLGRDNQTYTPDIRLKRQNFHATLKLFTALESLYFWFEHRMMAMIDRRLLHRCSTSFDGELVLFLVDPSARGHGIGRKLLNAFHQFRQEKKLHHIYVFTDTFCDYSFYDHNGFTQRQSLDITLRENGTRQTATYFLYSFDD